MKEILKRIIKLKTDGSEQGINECLQYIEETLNKKGWKTLLIPNKEDGKNNLIAVCGACEIKNINNAILLAGHIDTVIANKEKWSSDPFELYEDNENLYGLGVADMKNFTATVLSNLDKITKMPTKRPIIFVLTSDEETVMYGINAVIEFMKNNNIKPEFTIIGEPSSNSFATSNMGFYEFETSIFGKACHSSNPQLGVNAIYIMSKLITFIENFSKQYLEKGTTMNVGTIQGGTMCNIVAEKCTMRWDIRTFSREDLQEIQNNVNEFLNKLIKEYDGASYLNQIVFKIPPFTYRENETTRSLMRKYDINETTYSAATEAGFYQELGSNCVIFGCGDIKDCHSVNEKINKKEFQNYGKLLLNILKDVCNQ